MFTYRNYNWKLSDIVDQHTCRYPVNIVLRFSPLPPGYIHTHLLNSSPNQPLHTHTRSQTGCITMNMRATGPYQLFHLGSPLLFLSSSFWMSSPSHLSSSIKSEIWKAPYSNIVDFTHCLFIYVSLKSDIIMALKNPLFVWYLEQYREEKRTSPAFPFLAFLAHGLCLITDIQRPSTWVSAAGHRIYSVYH